MNNPRSFEQILEEKLSKSGSDGASFNHDSRDNSRENGLLNSLFHSENPNLAWLLGQISVKKPTLQRKNPYHRFRQAIARKPHNLSPQQTEAYLFIQTYVEGLSPGFSKRELKTAYRSAAKRLHPDVGGSPVSFQKLQMAYKSLLNLWILP